MSVETISVPLPPAARRRIDAVSAATGRPVADIAREAVEDGLDQVEYAATIQAEVAAIRGGAVETISQDELKRRLGDA
jgi:predicted DNA-binding protein